jgi:hypothetical protein
MPQPTLTPAARALGIALLLAAAGASAQAPAAASAAAASGTTAPAAASKPAPVKPAASTKPVPRAPAIEPEAVAAVERMGDYLKTLTRYTIRAETTTDEVLRAGPKVQFGGSIELSVAAPDRLGVRTTRDNEDAQQFFFDGKTLAVWTASKKTWAQVAAPGSIDEMIALVQRKYDVAFPLGDLLVLAVRKDLLKPVKAGIVVGTGRIGGVDCDHLAFHQDGIDWQLWIERGARPLPRKLIITTLAERGQPQHTEVLDWDLSPKFDDSAFAFVPPEGAQRIVIAERPASPPPKAASSAKAAPVKTAAPARKESP